ncbi:MerR family transcriptional regulator [Clostridium sp. P21]|uniref:MerR family transcriptional regulator n=1 Tax=Clostridium muellerianum TaxID=2716538 RepID=A0A7Y0EFM5_9CLOT|nr:MerR family transcriptional regulator [Clostridium muellerianum]
MKNFSIGEMSKLNNISIQTLRYYDKIGLLKPKLINKTSKYRYYSIEEFLKVDMIKYYKNVGLSLEEIKNLISSNTSIEEKLQIINIQQEALENKLKDMNLMKNNLDILKNKVSSIIECKINKIFIKYNEEREYISYDYISNTNAELEINYRKVILDIEKYVGMLGYELSSIVSYDKTKEKMVYKNIMINTSENILKHNGQVIVLPKGEYITVYFEGGCFANKNYYKKVTEYINKNNIKVNGHFHEIYIIPQVNEDGKENTLMQLEILKS